MTAVLIAGVLVSMSAVMAAGWLVQRRAGDSGWVDAFWTFGTGACGVAVALWPTEDAQVFRQMIVAALVAAWSLRLGGYIVARVLQGPEDARYVRLRAEWGEDYHRRLFSFMQVQAPCSAILCLSIALAAHHPAPGLRIADLAAIGVLVAAIAGETLADAQLGAFRSNPANHDKIIDRGLWSWSRHPNYFFEWLGWMAYPVMAIDPARPWTWLSLAAPALMYVILTRLTGVPYLEAHMARSRGQAWADYAARVSPFFPLPPKRAQT